MASSSLNVSDGVRSAISSVHTDNTGVEWTVIGYAPESKTELIVLGSGNSGGLSEVSKIFPGDDPAYALIRYSILIDKSSNVRFAFVDWTPDNTPSMKKSFISTQKGAIRKLFEPHHVDLVASDNSDLDETFILKKIGAASGTLSHVVETKTDDKVVKAAQHKAPTASSGKKGPSIASINAAVKINFVNEDEFKAGLAQVRDGNSETTWFLAALNDKLALEVLGSGPGTVEDLLAVAREGTVNYGVIRIVDVIDKSTTYKFAYVVYMPDDVPPMRKGKINTISGNIKDLFVPIHVDFFISEKSEISQHAVEDKVKFASGSKSHILN